MIENRIKFKIEFDDEEQKRKSNEKLLRGVLHLISDNATRSFGCSVLIRDTNISFFIRGIESQDP